nr:uncharacterized protein LOC127332556 [Lolium perenne]
MRCCRQARGGWGLGRRARCPAGREEERPVTSSAPPSTAPRARHHRELPTSAGAAPRERLLPNRGNGCDQTWESVRARLPTRNPLFSSPPSVYGAASSAISGIIVPTRAEAVGRKGRPRGPAIPDEPISGRGGRRLRHGYGALPHARTPEAWCASVC